METTNDYKLRKPCTACGGETGEIRTKNGQDCVWCWCGKYQYNAPRVETGRKPRTVLSVHEGITAKTRARIITRATGRCEMCGDRGNLHVGHIISVKAGLAGGLTEVELNDDENLSCLCEACNLGMGREPIPLRFALAMLMARLEINTDAKN